MKAVGAQRNALVIAGRAFLDLHKLVILHSGFLGGASNKWSVFRKSFTTGGYAPAAAFNWLGAEFMYPEAVASSRGTFLYNDNDIGYNATSSPAGATYLGGETSAAIYFQGTTIGFYEINLAGVQSPATKYISVYNLGTSMLCGVKLWGYE